MPAATSQYPVRDAGGSASTSSASSVRSASSRLPDQEKPPGLEIAGMRGVRPIAMRFERRPRRAERLHGPLRSRETSAISASATTHRARADRLLRAEGTRSAPQQFLRARKVAKLRHRDAAQRERRWIVAQRDPLQRRQRIARRERPGRGRDQRVHRNPVTLVTLTRLPSRPTSSLGPATAGNGDNRSGAEQ